MTNEQLLEQITELTDRFIRKIPQTPEYKNRLAEEIDLIIELRFTKHFVRVWSILELTKDLPHITRGCLLYTSPSPRDCT